MTRIINSNEDASQLPLASESECKTRRALLISSGVIKPAGKAELVEKKDGPQALSTRKSSRAWRRKLIDQGIIDPDPTYKPALTRRNYSPSDEGQYEPKPIQSEEEYIRRRNNYLWMVSDILKTRKNLRLILGKKADNDPDWYF